MFLKGTGLRSKSGMLDKIKKWLVGVGVAIIGVLLTLLHLKSKKVEKLQTELKKESANNNVNKQTVTLLEQQIEMSNNLDDSAESYNTLVDSFNGKNNEKK
jgi:uncharacterized membrane-anchored protein YhcB (DUF1043 family)